MRIPERPRGVAVPGGAAAPIALLERAAELAVLTEAVHAARAGRGGVVLVEGEVGVGKSTLLIAAQELAVRAGCRCLVARGSEMEGDYAFGVARQWFESEQSPQARPSFSAPEVGSRRLIVIVRELYELLVSLTRTEGSGGPLVLVVDDAHWADEPSVRLLVHLALRVSGLPVVLVLAVRTGEPGVARHLLLAELHALPYARTLRPALLSPAGIATIVRSILGEGAEPALIAACARASGGNCFYLRELLHGLAELGPGELAPRLLERVAPAGVRQSIVVRLARLGAGPAALARALAILGDGASLPLTARLAGLDTASAEAAADALVGSQILEPGTPLQFRHPVIASSLAADMGHFARARAHRKAAGLLLAERAPVARVAAHLLRSEPDCDERTVEVLRAAAADAVASGVPSTAARLLVRALDESPGSPRPHLVMNLAKAEALAGRPEAAARLERALAEMPPGLVRAEALAELAALLHHQGEFGRTVELARRARAELAPDHPGQERLLAVELAAASLHPDLLREAATALDPLLAATRAGRPPTDPSLLALVVGKLGTADPPALVRSTAQAAIAADPIIDESHGESLGWVAYALIASDELDLAERWLGEVIATTQRRGQILPAAVATLNRATVRYHAGTLDLAVEDAERALDFHHRGWTSSPWSIPVLVTTHVARGDLPAARAALAAADGVGEATPDHALLLEARAQLHLADGDTAAALAEALEAGRLIEHGYGVVQPRLWAWRRLAAMAALRLGRPAQASELVEPDLATLRAIGPPRQLAAALTVAGLARGGHDGLDLLTEAVTVLAGSPSRLQHAQSLLELGSAHRRAGHPNTAKEPLLAALDLAGHLGAAPLAARARDELRAVGLRPRRTTRYGPGALTPSERRVAQLAAQGLSTPEIARTLYVSTATVETHLGHTYRKLGVRSRRDLAQALSGSGETPVGPAPGP